MAATEKHFRYRFNQAQLRSFRERERVAFLCECGEEACHRTVVLSPAEYEALRPEPILHPSHRAAP